jgi:predicted GNAT superfamily acetyltransferase
MPLAIRWREATREAFVHYLSRGYEAREFLRGESVSSYILVGPGGGTEGAAGGTTA